MHAQGQQASELPLPLRASARERLPRERAVVRRPEEPTHSLPAPLPAALPTVPAASCRSQRPFPLHCAQPLAPKTRFTLLQPTDGRPSVLGSHASIFPPWRRAKKPAALADLGPDPSEDIRKVWTCPLAPIGLAKPHAQILCAPSTCTVPCPCRRVASTALSASKDSAAPDGRRTSPRNFDGPLTDPQRTRARAGPLPPGGLEEPWGDVLRQRGAAVPLLK